MRTQLNFAQEVRFGGGLILGDTPIGTGVAPSLFFVPTVRNPYFTGRDRELSHLRERLVAEDGQAIVAVRAIGGVGKSELAREFCFRHRDDFTHIIWLDASSEAAFTRSLALVAEVLQPATSDVASTLEQRAEALLRWLTGQDAWLLVLDGVNDLDSIWERVPHGDSGSLLITTQRITGLLARVPQLDLGVLPEDASVEFLVGRTTGSLNVAAAKEIASTLEFLPLALEQAGGYIAASGVTGEEYVALLQDQARDLLARGRPPGYAHTVNTTWSVTLEKLESADRHAIHLVRLLARWAPAGPFPIFTDLHCLKQLSPQAKDLFASKITLADAVATVREYGLARLDDNRCLSMHALLASVVVAEDANSPQAGSVRTAEHDAVGVLLEMFPPDARAGGALRVARTLITHVLMLLSSAPGAQVARDHVVDLSLHAARYLAATGEHAAAINLLSQVEDNAVRRGPDFHARLLLLRGREYHARAKSALAVADLQRAMQKVREMPPAEQPRRLAGILRSLAEAHQRGGQPKSALQAAQESVDVCLAAGASADDLYSESLHTLGSIFELQGDLDQAILHLSRALELSKLRGDSPAALAHHHRHLGMVLQKQGLLDAALEAYETALTHDREIDAQQGNYDVYLDLARISDAAESAQLWDRAVQYRREAVDVIADLLGTEHPTAKRAVLALASTLAVADRPSEATAVLGEVEEYLSSPPSNVAEGLALLKYALARHHVQHGSPTKALAHLQDLVKPEFVEVQPEHAVALVHCMTARAYMRQGNLLDAEKVCKAAVQVWARLGTPYAHDLARERKHLADIRKRVVANLKPGARGR